MRGAIFVETLRRTWPQMLYWGVGLAFLGYLIVTLVPDVDGLQEMAALMGNLPPVLLRALGMHDDLTYIATPEGFVTIGFFGRLRLLLAFYPLIMGLRVTINEEDSGTMDVLLSLPVARWRVVLEKFLAYTATVTVIIVLFFVGLWLGSQTSGVELNFGRVAQTCLNALPSMTVILAFTVFIGTLVRSRRQALGISLLFVVGSFMLDAIGATASGSLADNLRALSFFRYFDSAGVMHNGLIVGDVALLLVVAAILLAASLWIFERRDVGL